MLEKSLGEDFSLLFCFIFFKKSSIILTEKGTIAQWESICLTCKGSGVQVPLVPPLELSIADTKVLAIFSFLGINTANINDL